MSFSGRKPLSSNKLSVSTPVASKSGATSLRNFSPNSGDRKKVSTSGSEDLFVRPYTRPGFLETPKKVQNGAETMSRSPTKPSFSTMGTKDPLSYGPRTTTGTGSSLSKYGSTGKENGSNASVDKVGGGTRQKLFGGQGFAKEVQPGGANLEICKDPKFFVDGVSRFDVKQGILGNCWFLAAVGNLTIYEDLFFRVVPRDNNFDDGDYCGIFHFRFWQYGKWIDVVVDDRLPCDPDSGKLCFMHSYENNEFWSALMEKAYAKIHGSYEALDGGTSNEALQDFCGGIVEVVKIRVSKVEDVGQTIETAFQRHSFICCSVAGHAGIREAITDDGLVHGHAYTVTSFKRIEVGPTKSKVGLLRIRNPWGNEKEWNGAWSDGSKEWDQVSGDVKKSIELIDRKDGEFWIRIEDFKDRFEELNICNLSPSSYRGISVQGKKWNESDFNGQWIPWATAGGCSKYIFSDPLTYPNNPQFIVEFATPDDNGDPKKCTVLIGLMQKNRRAKRKEGSQSLSIGYSIYALDGATYVTNPLGMDFFKRNSPVGRSGDFCNSRVVNARFELDPGKYCVIPCTFEPNLEGEFVLRIFSESHNTITENGGITELDDDDEEEKKPKVPLTKEQIVANDAITKLFNAAAGEDEEIGWAKLKKLLDTSLKKEFKFDGFNGEVCRSLVALLDKDRSGKIGLSEFQELWTNVLLWKNAFIKYDTDHSNTMSAGELRNALKSVGISLSNRTLETLVLRYGNDSGVISFEDFIMCAVKLNAMIATFKEFQSDGKNEAKFGLEDWLQKSIYS